MSNLCVDVNISIHAPREGGDDSGDVQPIQGTDFNPRPPRGGRPQCLHHHFFRICISIHAPREGGDVTMYQLPPDIQPISIHAPREGGDFLLCLSFLIFDIFQSTPPARGATPRRGCWYKWLTFQSTPPARGATGVDVSADDFQEVISIHAPREGGDYRPGTLP